VELLVGQRVHRVDGHQGSLGETLPARNPGAKKSDGVGYGRRPWKLDGDVRGTDQLGIAGKEPAAHCEALGRDLIVPEVHQG
jgi:hypothetical protein